MYCQDCGERIVDANKFCPQCGSSISGASDVSHHSPMPSFPKAGTDSFCIGSAITGVIALLIPLFGITGMIAIILGVQGRGNANRNGMGGGGLAVLGIILGIVSLLWIIFIFASLSTR